MFLLCRVSYSFHVSENSVSVASLQSLHELQVVADLEALDRLLLQVKKKRCFTTSNSAEMAPWLLTVLTECISFVRKNEMASVISSCL